MKRLRGFGVAEWRGESCRLPVAGCQGAGTGNWQPATDHHQQSSPRNPATSQPRNHTPWLSVTTASLAASMAAASLGGFAQYDRAALLRGEIWRLVTGHFAHWSPAHLGWDLLAFLVLGVLCERRRLLLAAVIAGTALAASLFVFRFHPEVSAYRGLSAIDSALWTWFACFVAQRRRTLAIVLFALFGAKLLLEVTAGPLFTHGFVVMPSVHLIGAAIGFCAAMAEHKMAVRTDAALQRSQSRDLIRRRGDEPALVGGAA